MLMCCVPPSFALMVLVVAAGMFGLAARIVFALVRLAWPEPKPRDHHLNPGA